jgi:membrane associated rhomboid family serine protease
MFFVLPVYVRDSAARHAIPLANAVLIVANVLLFCFGWSAHWAVGPGTNILSIVGYGFAHASIWHLAGNMWTLMVVGNPVNRRLGNGYYLLLYMGTLVALGLFFRLFCSGDGMGASGAIFAVIAACVLLMPAYMVELCYFALFPITLLIGLFHRPKHWVYWFIRWDWFELRALWGIVLVPFLELWGLYWWGWNWTNLGHLFGVVCGVAIVLMLPEHLTMKRRRSSLDI